LQWFRGFTKYQSLKIDYLANRYSVKTNLLRTGKNFTKVKVERNNYERKRILKEADGELPPSAQKV